MGHSYILLDIMGLDILGLIPFTFKQFYEEKVGSKFSDWMLKQVFVGQAKERLDLVDYDLVVAEVLSVFGRYLNYNVEKESDF